MSSVNPVQTRGQRAAAEMDTFGKRLGDYARWRSELVALINEYQNWVESQGLSSGEDDLKIYELLDDLRADHLEIALVAEVSRGKTELVNAIFFADYKQRLLPSDAGRTTMCPTELLHDESMQPGLRLLPIETRRTPTTIAELKRQPIHWTTLPLNLASPKQMADTLMEIVRVKGVAPRVAEELGLYNPSQQGIGPTPTPEGLIEIPVWRHAVINFPHPLLKQGLVILDTPGLNSLGTEPELTLSMIPSAHVVLFLLAADTGVTKSDLDVWTNHVCTRRAEHENSHIAVLNKIDTMWDELRGDQVVAAQLARQVLEVGARLDLRRENVFPVSAQKGLLAKIKRDYALLEKSGIPELELKLSGELISAKQQLLRERIVHDLGTIIETTRTMVASRLKAIQKQLAEMHAMSGKSQDAIQVMIQRMREEKSTYDKTLASFQNTRMVLNDQIKMLLDLLSVEAFDQLASRSRRNMNDAWTTHGLRVGMKVLFEGIIEAMDKAHRQTMQIRGLAQAIYGKFHKEHGLAEMTPAAFSLTRERAAMQKFYKEAEIYRNSPMMVMTAQHFVVQKLYITLVSRMRELFGTCNESAKNWSKAVMSPITAQVREHKILMEQRLENLKKVHENLGNLGTRVQELETTQQNLENQIATIESMLQKLALPATPQG